LENILFLQKETVVRCVLVGRMFSIWFQVNKRR